MARAMDWEKANRTDRANRPEFAKPARPRKGSEIYTMSRLLEFMKIVQSDKWGVMSSAYRNQVLYGIKLGISRISRTRAKFSETAIAKRALKLIAENS